MDLKIFQKKQTISPTISSNEYINLSDIRSNFLYTKDDKVFTYLSVAPISTALMTENEKGELTKKLSMAISPLNTSFKLILISRPTDVKTLIAYYESIKSVTSDTKKRDNLTKTIREISKMTTQGGVLERQTFIALSANKNEEEELLQKTTVFRQALISCAVRCNICTQTEISQMLSLFYNPISTTLKNIDFTNNYSFMEEQNG